MNKKKSIYINPVAFLSRIALGVVSLFLIVACSSDNPFDPDEDEGDDPKPDTYVAPLWPDDYTTRSSWDMREQWNLANVHDPTIEKSGDYYYLYSTDTSYGDVHKGKGGHFMYRRSRDLVNWSFLGFAMAETTAWVKDTLNNMRIREQLPVIPEEDISYAYWAPVVRKVGNKYRMYYSIVVNNYIRTGKPTSSTFDNSWTERAFIGLMESDVDLGMNRWTDKGMVVCSISDKPGDWYRPNKDNWSGYFYYNGIDPSFIETPEGEHWLIFGSWHSGIGAIQLDPATGIPYKFEDYKDVTHIATRTAGDRWQGSEAPEIIYREGYYYLFLAYDELSVDYNTRVCRSKSITGPYYGIDGANVTAGESACYPVLTHPYKFNNHHGWVGISHNCVFRDDEGNWYYSSQARLPKNLPGVNASNANMLGFVNQIRWTSDGWPVVMPERYAAVPDTEIADEELVGTWEVITQKWDLGKQNTSVAMTLAADGTATGAISGNWTYDPGTKRLHIGNQELQVERGLDWESTPRVRTIIFSGLKSTDKRHSLWGKKIG
ncbi:MAG: arabinan endo-1,5-alpha-L-arabinosidase [Tannerellaceae bacterium]|nr:arabinan endo-1,5-alpha-L-arabinosidase [Tannerellaceae bacterium]